jgi:hypothetical protein
MSSSSAVTTFDSIKEFLEDLLKSVAEGRTQLPDFQRGWIWDDEHIRSLLASVSRSFPIGAMMMLQTGNEPITFKPRLIEGVALNGTGGNNDDPERLILDGQQRITSLFQALYSGNVVETVDARKKKIKRWYYMDMRVAVHPFEDREDAIIGLPEDRLIRNFRNEIIEDYSTSEHEFETGMFPLAQVFDYTNWRSEYNKYWDYDSAKIEQFDQFEADVIKRFERYQIPVIELRAETPKEAVCQVFEKVNTGGVTLTVFELLTATYAAASGFNLREDWLKRDRWLKSKEENGVLAGVNSDDFLQAVTLLATFWRRVESIRGGEAAENAPGISCKRRDILRLTLDEFQKYADPVTAGFEKAARLLHSQKIFGARDLPYNSQLTPLAAMFAVLGDKADSGTVRTKLIQWFWCGVFGEMYSSAAETRFVRDLPEMLIWVEGGAEPSTVTEANFFPNRLLTLKTRNSAAYKGLSALLLRDNALNFQDGETIDMPLYADEKVDIHHIFPRDWCIQNGINANRRDCIVNKTPVTGRVGRRMGNNAPSVYLGRMQKDPGMTIEGMNEILESHLIHPDSARADDFETFFELRKESMLERIEWAMGKAVPLDADEDMDSAEDFADDEDDDGNGNGDN